MKKIHRRPDLVRVYTAFAVALLMSVSPTVHSATHGQKELTRNNDSIKVTELRIVDVPMVEVSAPGDSVKVFVAVEESPRFPGGDAELYKWIARNIRYPEEAALKDIQGRVMVQMIIEKDGSIGPVKVVRSVDPLLDAEALRVVKTLPKFAPGRMNGSPVRVWYTLPITFKIAVPESKISTDSVK